jgi:hypothetical protein
MRQMDNFELCELMGGETACWRFVADRTLADRRVVVESLDGDAMLNKSSAIEGLFFHKSRRISGPVATIRWTTFDS